MRPILKYLNKMGFLWLGIVLEALSDLPSWDFSPGHSVAARRASYCKGMPPARAM